MSVGDEDSMYSASGQRKMLRRVPKPKRRVDTFKEILKLATDKRGHLMISDQCDWLELKMKAIAKLARHGKTLN